MKGRPKATARWTSGARRHPGGAAQKSPTRRRAGRPRWPAAAGLRLGARALVLPRQPSRLRPIRSPPGLGPPETDRHPSDQEGHLGAMGPTARRTHPKRAARGSYGYRLPPEASAVERSSPLWTQAAGPTTGEGDRAAAKTPPGWPRQAGSPGWRATHPPATSRDGRLTNGAPHRGDSPPSSEFLANFATFYAPVERRWRGQATVTWGNANPLCGDNSQRASR